MPVSLLYLPSNKNIGDLFSKISSATVPPTFTQEFLQNTIGLKGSNDRPLIPMLRTLGFLDQSNTPTATYSLLKGKGEVSKAAIADGVKKAYASLFNANEDAHELTGEKLKSLISQVAGVDDDMTARIASTFSSLVKQGNFNVKATVDQSPRHDDSDEQTAKDVSEIGKKKDVTGLRAEFQYVIQVQLPSNGSEDTYLNIFNAIRKTFQ